MNTDLLSKRIELADPEQAMDYFFNMGWTDGLPVVPPTEQKVRTFLEAAHLDPQEILATIPERNRIFSAEKVAVNAVMAGCLPEYFPVVVAAVRAMGRPEFGLHGATASTAGVGLLMVINGPIVKQLGLNSGQNVLGPGNRANATIGRALRLILVNLGGKEFDRGTIGHPGKYTYCLAEDEDTLWEPLHVTRGLGKEVSAVTLLAAEGPNQVQNHIASKPENLLNTLADRMRALGSFHMGGDCEGAVIICKEHYQTLISAHWKKEDVKHYLYKQARRTLADLKRGGLIEAPIVPEDEQAWVSAVSSPDHILLVVAGGEAGRFSAFIPGWAGRHMSKAVTLPTEPSCSGDICALPGLQLEPFKLT